MKSACKRLASSILVLGLAMAGCSKKSAKVFSIPDKAAAAQLKQFVLEKQIEADAATNEAPPEFAAFFAAAQKGDWLSVSNAFEDLRTHAAQYQGSTTGTDARLHGTRWEAVKEIWGAFYAFGRGEEKYSAAFGNDIIQSIPDGSIYFGGTDPGRFIITAMQKSQVNGEPFFTLTQNALADPTYLEYAHSLYSDQLHIPSKEDASRCFDEYSNDAAARLAKHKLRPGENVHLDANGKVAVSGQVAVMDVNARILKVIFDQNTNHEFYIEESFPLDWMYPYLEPHGLILKINRTPAEVLPEAVLQTDHDYWAKYTAPMIGDWLNENTTVNEVADFAEKTYVKHDLSGFKGDPQFLKSSDAQKTFSKLRSSIAGVYSWRVGVSPSGGSIPPEYTQNDAARQRIAREADFAFKQAFALCPTSPEAVYRYVGFLMQQGRKSDALLIAQTASHVDPKNNQFGYLIGNLSR